MTTSTTRVSGFRVAGFVALGLEFARSHGAEYARALMEEIGANEDAIALMLKQYADESPKTAPSPGGV